MHKASLEVRTRGIGLYDVTRELERVVRESQIVDGLAIVFVRHTSASLLIQEAADPSVQEDLLEFFARLVPEGHHYRHGSEGSDDMPAHIRSALTHSSEVIPVAERSLQLGTWQGLYLFEHRRSPHRRRLEVRVLAG